jgi:hypothetical protein
MIRLRRLATVEVASRFSLSNPFEKSMGQAYQITALSTSAMVDDVNTGSDHAVVK